MLVMVGSALVSAQPGGAARDQRRRQFRPDVWTFEKDTLGSVPKSWKASETAGKGTPAQWQVIADDSAPEGSQTFAITANKNSGRTYNLLIAQESSYQDLGIKVSVKAVTGKEDQGGGPIWRAKDGDNYYIARWNPLEDNFRVYYVKDGRRKQLGSADVKADPKAWHDILIMHRGTRIIAMFDGKKMIELEDATFGEAGMVGLWTKADGRTAFDDLTPRRLAGN